LTIILTIIDIASLGLAPERTQARLRRAELEVGSAKTVYRNLDPDITTFPDMPVMGSKVVDCST
jgi:hypothetical protein